MYFDYSMNFLYIIREINGNMVQISDFVRIFIDNVLWKRYTVYIIDSQMSSR